MSPKKSGAHRFGDPRKRQAAAHASAHTWADLRRLVRPDGENILMCRPVKPSPEVLAHYLKTGVTMRPARVDDTLGRCQRCHAGVWIGPIQLSLLKAGKATEVVCMDCVYAAEELEEMPILDLDPDRDSPTR